MNLFTYTLRVHVEDTDFAGVVYHSNYLNFMERARSEWFALLGFGIEEQRKEGIYFPLRYANIEFLKPAYLHQTIEVVTTIKSIGKASIIFDQHLRDASSNDKILCKAEIKLACVDKTFRPRALPDVPIIATIRRSLT